jgi:pilus assembly protein CpaC
VTTAVRLVGAAILAVTASGVVALGAQDAPPQPPNGQSAVPRVTLTVGRSLVHPTAFDIIRVAITDPAVADATVVSPREILLDGKAAGTVSLIVWGLTERAQYDVVVDPGVSALQRQLQMIFPGEDIQASETADSVILTGRASTNAIAPEAKIINLLQLPGGDESQQVMLQVRIAEVNRRALSELGVSLFTGPTGVGNTVSRITTQQFSAPTFEDLQTFRTSNGFESASGQIQFSDFMNLFFFNNELNVGVLIRALQANGNFQSLAEPNLIAYNGQEASFLAGGEIPVPIVQGNSGQVTIEWKEFGVRLAFTPTIAGDVIRLRVRPEVSQLDFANGISLGGFRVPALTTRRAETDVELRDGQSFAIGGLMNNSAQDSAQAIPFISQIPIIGNLFKSKSTARERTELLVLVTPRLVRALNPDEVPPLPTVDELFLPGDQPAEGASTPAPAQTPSAQ